MNKHISILVTLVLGFSCTGKKQASPEVDQQEMKLVVSDNVGNIPRVESDYTEIDATNMKALSYPDFITEFVDSAYFVQLSSDELIGNITKLQIFEDRIYVLDRFSAKKVFIFDRQGKLLKVIDDQGGGPKEYCQLGDMYINEDTRELIIADLRGKYVHYNLNGEWLRSTSVISESYYDYPMGQDSAFNFMVYDYSLVLSKGSEVLKKAFPVYPIQRQVAVRDPFAKTGLGELLYIPLCCDTVYQLNRDLTYRAKYFVKQENSMWKHRDEELSDQERTDLIFNGCTGLGNAIFENEKFFVFTMTVRHKNMQLVRACFYNKEKKKTFYFDITKPYDTSMLLEKSVFPIGNPICLYGDYFVTSFTPVPIKENAHLANEEYLKIMNAGTDDTNPALVFYKLNPAYE
jgi:hypothetical protein